MEKVGRSFVTQGKGKQPFAIFADHFTPLRMRFTILCLLALVLVSCTADTSSTANTVAKAPELDLSTAMLGTWEIIDLQVVVPTYLGEDSTVVESIREADWMKIYGAKPARTTFTPDGKLRRTHYFANGQVADVTHGLWKVNGDSLIFIEPNVIYHYFPVLSNEKLELTGRVDWDKDKEVDDEYRATFRLVSRTLD